MRKLLSVLLVLSGTAIADPLPDLFAELRPHLDSLREIPQPPDQPVERYPEPLPDVSSLVGVERSRVKHGLGTPTGCIERGESTSHSAECEIADEWWYSFYRLPSRTLGGGLELVLSFDDKDRCASARWLHSQ